MSLPFAVVVSFFCAFASAQSEPIDTGPIEQEVAMLTEVLEQSVPARFRGIRPGHHDDTDPDFQHRIRGRYIPTVGIIITVPVSIPLRSTARYSNSGDRPPAPERSDERSSARYRVEERSPADGTSPKTIDAKPVRVSEDAKSEKTDVELLRASLFTVIAEHGHRLSHLDDDERVLVVVESGVTAATQRFPSRRSTVHYQIAVKKRDLTTDQTAEALETVAEETHY